MLRIKLVKSLIGEVPKNVKNIKALGIRKPGDVVEHHDRPEIRGIVHQVKHLLSVEEVEGEPKRSARPRPAHVAKRLAARSGGADAAAPAKPKRAPKKAATEEA